MNREILPIGEYHVVLRDALLDEKNLRLVWTIDVGEHAGRNLHDTFSTAHNSRTRLIRCMNEINCILTFPEDVDAFLIQFTMIRAKVTIDVTMAENTVRNRIIKYDLPLREPQVDIFAEPDDSHFKTQFKPKKVARK